MGNWNLISDVNTLVDPGTDGFIIEEIERISTGFGKVPVEQIILTHNHFDHSTGIEYLKNRFNVKVYAYNDMKGVDELLHDGQILRGGDDYLEVLHTPGHSSDSICLYCQSLKILFSGDTQLHILSPGGMYTEEYADSLLKISRRDIETVYSGHDEPVSVNVNRMILETLRNVRSTQ